MVWNGSASTFFAESSMFTQEEFCEGTHAFGGFFLFVVTLEPDITIGVGVGKRPEERQRVFFMEIDGTDNICNQSKVDEFA